MAKRRRFRGFPAVLALLVFAGLGWLPWVHPTNTTPPWVVSIRSAAPIRLPTAPSNHPPIKLSTTAQPLQPAGRPARQPTGNSTFLSNLVNSQGNRVRTLLRESYHVTSPSILAVPESLPTLVLPARGTPYTMADLVTAGVIVPWERSGWYLLVDSVFVAPSATLNISGAGLGDLLMGTSAAGFTSIVTWGGTISIAGSPSAPLAITGWDETDNRPAQDPILGRPYIRDVGGQLVLNQVRVSSLGFWSGPTGGVAWTGTSGVAATGEAISSTFMDNTYGAFVSNGYHVQFAGDLFESNQLDGLRLHRGADNSTVSGSAAARNGEHGFVISRGDNDVLDGDVALHNARDGFLLNGQPLNTGASPSGHQTVPSTGAVLSGSEAKGNGHYGIEVVGGAGTVVRNDIVCGTSTGIAVRLSAIDTWVVDDQVRCGRRVALAIGPAVIDTTVSGNVLSQSRIGILIRNSPNIRLLNNHLTGLSVFGIAVRGTSEGVVGSGNSIAGNGFAPIQASDGARSPSLSTTNLAAWKRAHNPTVLSYLRYHPLLTTWLVILLLVALFCMVTRLRRRPSRPYRHVLPWQPSEVADPGRHRRVLPWQPSGVVDVVRERAAERVVRDEVTATPGHAGSYRDAARGAHHH